MHVHVVKNAKSTEFSDHLVRNQLIPILRRFPQLQCFGKICMYFVKQGKSHEYYCSICLVISYYKAACPFVKLF